jgi:hypothetical protein
MVVEKREQIVYTKSMEIITEETVSSDRLGQVIPLPKVGRITEKISSKGYIMSPKHDFL